MFDRELKSQPVKTSTPNSITDEALLHDLQHGGDIAFDKIYNLYFQIMFNHAFRMIDNEDDAKDVVQELFIQLHQKKHELRPGTSIPKFLYFTLRNRVLNLIRNEKTYSQYLENYKTFAEEHQDNILETLYEKDLQLIIDREISKLPPRMREIFELSRFEYLTYKEIGEKLDISPKTVKAQIRNAILAIRSQLPEHLVAIAAADAVFERFFH